MTDRAKTIEYSNLQDRLRASGRNLWLAGLGVISSVEEGGTELFDQLVTRGRKAEAESRKRLSRAKDDLESTADALTDKWDRRVASVLQRVGVPSRLQVETLTERVDKLVNQVDRLSGTRTKTASRSTRKKATGARKTKAA